MSCHKTYQRFSVLNEDDANFSWTKDGTKLLLKNYAERKDEFCNPLIRKKTLWIQIVKDFKMKGYDINIEMLDRKMRNLKHFYRRIKNERKLSEIAKHKKISWEWYDLMENIFGEKKTIDTVLPFSVEEINNEQIYSEEIKIEQDVEEDKPSTVPFTTCQTASTINSTLDNTLNNLPNRKSKRQKCTKAKTLYHLRRKQLECEEKRITAIKELKEVINEHNIIQRERNEILRHIIQSSKIISEVI